MSVLWKVLLLLLAVCTLAKPVSSNPARGGSVLWRVLLILADDCGQELLDVSPTPNIDRIAAQGVLFETCWSAPKCSASRARIFTGAEAWRDENLIGGNVFPTGSYELHHSDVFVRYLPGSKSFYGKLHVALDSSYTWPVDAKFDTWLGSMSNLGPFPNGFYNWEKATESGKSNETEYATRVIGESALVDVELDVDFVYVAFHEAHRPYDIPPLDMAPISHQGSLVTDLEIAKAKVEAMDTAIGWLIDEAIPRDYVVIFLSDNSSHPELGLGGQKGALSNKGLNVPLIAYHSTFPAGLRSGLVQTTDLAATIMDLRGELGQAPVDSVSFYDALIGGSLTRAWVRSERFSPNGTTPVPGPNWKRGIREGGWSLYHRNGWKLYDLSADPDEDTNLWPPDLGPEQDAYNRLFPNMQG